MGKKNSISDAEMGQSYSFRGCVHTCKQDHPLTKELGSLVVGIYDFQMSSQSPVQCENVTVSWFQWNGCCYVKEKKKKPTCTQAEYLSGSIPASGCYKAQNGFHRQVVTHSHNELLNHRYSHIKGGSIVSRCCRKSRM